MFNPRQTIVRRISAERPEANLVAEAADVLRRGGLVAFPTETVYGLGANALDAAAVGSIFEAKGRPPNNPIIVHVADAAAARELTTVWPPAAEQLADRFWPGPMALVLPKRACVPDMATGGGRTVGIRVPSHPVALALLRSARVPIAAPSANRSTAISPTTAEHVLRSLDGRVDLILDAGPTPGGLESTVVDLTTDPPRVLRPGLVTVEQLKSAIGRYEVGTTSTPSTDQPLRSPGMLERHYAPRAQMLCLAEDAASRVDELLAAGKRVGWMRCGQSQKAESRRQKVDGDRLLEIEMPSDVAGYSAQLYAALHELDAAAVDVIVVDLPPRDEAWLAVLDRLKRASAAK